ncbi:MAG TPA: tetratricopeptide repeat protein [Gammaproteobacteria bacterium]|nr:tetratricopeptide repeat protein [Gammaproteobacteria bacterium]
MINSPLQQNPSANVARLLRLSTHCALAALMMGSVARAQPPKYDEAFTDGYFWYQQGRVQAAQQKWEKLLKLQPDNQEVKAALSELKQFDPARVRKELVEQARDLARKHRYQDAIEVYRSAFGGPPPTSFYALEYYETLSGAKAGWSEAIEHLRKLADTYPSNPAFRLTLAKVLSYREQTRREAIHKLSELATSDSLPQAQRQEAQQAWRQALLWLNATLDDKPLYDAYLKVDSDPVVAQTLANIDQPGGKIGEAYALLEQGHTEQARKRFREILANDPENAEAIAGLGIIELRQHRFSKAQRLLEQSIHQDPEKRHTLGQALRDARYWSLVHRGRRAFTRRQFDKAAALARRAARLKPGRIEPTLLKASIENARGRYQKSLDLYKKALKKRPRNLEARQGVVQNYLALKDDISARSAIHKYKLPSRAYQQALTRIQVENLRRDAALLGNDPNAIEILQDALDLAPDDPWIRLDLARLYHRLGREDEALSLFDNLLKARPGQADIFYAKALYHEENKQWREGLLAMQAIPGDEMDAGKRALKRHLWAYNEQRKALELIAAGDTKQARLIAQEIKSVSRLNDPETALPYAELLAALGDEREALRIGRQFVDPIFSPDIDTRISFGNLLLKTGHRQELASLLERIETRSGGSLNARQQNAIDRLKDGSRLQQADVEKLAGKYDQALQTLAAPPLVADNRKAFTLLRASIEMAHGQHREAVTSYQSILAEDPGNETAWAGAASAALAADDKPLASRLIEQGLQHRPMAPRLLALRSQINQLKGKQGAASRDLELALSDPAETFGKSADAPDWLTRARQKKARLDDAARSRLSIGLGSRDRGDNGLDQITEYSLPLELDYRLPNEQRIGFNLRNVILDGPGTLKSVEQKSRDFNLAYFGGLPIFLSNPKNFDPDLNADGLAFNLRYRNDNWLIDAGSKPSGFLGDSLVGGVKWQGQTFTRKYSIEYDQRAIKESVLAYAGAHDPQFDREWGGVVRSGVNLSFDQQIRRRFGFYTHLGFHNLTGKNVASNDEKGFQLGGYWQLDRQTNRSLSLGLGLQYRKFDKNLRFFTLGHGGYFSPQRYLALTLPLEYFRQKGRLTYHVNLSPGLFTLEETSAPLFPNDPALQNRWEELASSRDKLEPTYKSRTDNGFLYSLQADLGFRLDNQFTLTGWLDANNTTDFNEFAAGVGLTYYFTPARAPTDKLQNRERTGLHEVW